MVSREQLIKARLAILTMATELRNVVKVCKLAGVSRSQFYAMKKAYKTHGKEGLAPRARRKPRMPNRTPVSLEGQILAKTHDNPAVSYLRLAGQMQLQGIAVTPAMVRYVWQRKGLSTRSARVQWVKRQSGARDVFRPFEGRPRLQSSSAFDPLPATVTPSAISEI